MRRAVAVRGRAQWPSVLSIVILGAILFGVWWPEAAHYWVPAPRYQAATIEALRAVPTDNELDRLGRISFEPSGGSQDPGHTVAAANSILRGKWYDPEFGERDLTFPFSGSDLDVGMPTEQLRFASLGHVDTLLSAYQLTHDDRFLAGAKEAVNAWSEYERRALLPRGMLWNDHAVANRVLVLTRYWGLLRGSPLYDEKSGRLAVEFIGRSGRMLAKPSHYTVRTNHGLIQNLALLQIASAFPALPDSQEFQSVAVDRSKLQLRFYQPDEGVVLEHSLGYHVFGMAILDAFAQYGAQLGDEFMREIERRRSVACEFFTNVVRPDGSLPMIGDTPASPTTMTCSAPSVSPVEPGGRTVRLSTYPVSGYAIAWYTGGLGKYDPMERSQTVVAWGNFSSHAHKHADDMSVVNWIAGRPVLTGVGYWPIGHALQAAALSWRGANGPHFSWEGSSDPRRTELEASGVGQSLAAMDLVRTTADLGSTIRRQIVTLGADRWAIVDFAESSRADLVTTVWTLFPSWAADPGPNDSTIRFSNEGTANDLQLSVSSPEKVAVRTLSASSDPFGGFVTFGMSPSEIRTSLSVEVTAQPGQPVATVLSAANMDQGLAASFQRWAGPTDWAVCLDGQRCAVQLARNGMLVTFRRFEQVESVEMLRLGDRSSDRVAIDRLYQGAVAEYPRWRDYYSYRAPVSWALAGLLAFQELFFAVSRRLLRYRASRFALYLNRVHWMTVPAWLIVGYWVVFRYLGQSA